MKPKIYCAGPLFNPKEKEEMLEIATVLENNGFDVFLPHRDGFEFSKLNQSFIELGFTGNEAKMLLNRAIFILDVFMVLDSQGLILNANGRVPDEGAMVEAGIAWNAGRLVKIYKNDTRTLLDGNENPLMLGLSNFEIIKDISLIPESFSELTELKNICLKDVDNSHVKDLFRKGREIASLLRSKEIDRDFGEFLVGIISG